MSTFLESETDRIILFMPAILHALRLTPRRERSERTLRPVRPLRAPFLFRAFSVA